MADIQKCADNSQFGQSFILDKTFSNNILTKRGNKNQKQKVS